MTAVIIAPRIEDAQSDTERIVSAGFFQLRPSKTYVANGQWVQGSWSDPVAFDGTAKTAMLDALPDNPYELYAEYPDNRGGTFVIREFRTVLDSASPVKWETLTPSGGPGSTVPVPTNFEARLLAVEQALGNVSGGATNLAGISDMTDLSRTFNKRTTGAQVRSDIGAGTSSLAIGTTSGTAADAVAVAISFSGVGTRLDGHDTALGEKAPLASPAFTGNPTAPTPAQGDNDTSVATTAFVATAVGAINPPSGFAPIASPAFTGNPTAPTPAVGDNDTSVATTAFVKAEPVSLAQLPANTVVVIRKSGSTWPARPTSRADIVVDWEGADPSPPIVSSGTGGMRENDRRSRTAV